MRPSGDEEFDAWSDVVADGVAHPDTEGVPSPEEFPRDVIARAERDFPAAGVMRYVALRDGLIAGGAGLRMAECVAQLTGAATAPAHRRHGIQTVLLAARLADAAAAGCDVAVVTTRPASKSQQNVQRRGFDLLYTRAILPSNGPVVGMPMWLYFTVASTLRAPASRASSWKGPGSDLVVVDEGLALLCSTPSDSRSAASRGDRGNGGGPGGGAPPPKSKWMTYGEPWSSATLCAPSLPVLTEVVKFDHVDAGQRIFVLLDARRFRPARCRIRAETISRDCPSRR